MRRRLSLVLFALLLIVVAVAGSQYVSSRRQAQRVANARRDTTARADSAQVADTMCFASRLGFPCDPR